MLSDSSSSTSTCKGWVPVHPRSALLSWLLSGTRAPPHACSLPYHVCPPPDHHPQTCSPSLRPGKISTPSHTFSPTLPHFPHTFPQREFGFKLDRDLIVDDVRVRGTGSSRPLPSDEGKGVLSDPGPLPEPVVVTSAYFEAGGRQGTPVYEVRT